MSCRECFHGCLAFLAAAVPCLMAFLHIHRHCLGKSCQFQFQTLPGNGFQEEVLGTSYDPGHRNTVVRWGYSCCLCPDDPLHPEAFVWGRAVLIGKSLASMQAHGLPHALLTLFSTACTCSSCCCTGLGELKVWSLILVMPASPSSRRKSGAPALHTRT